MTRMNSAAAESSLSLEPKNVCFLGTIFETFRFPTAMSVGDVLEIKNTCEVETIPNRYFNFLLKKTLEERVSILCERHVKDETLKADSVVEHDALEEDDGCFLRLYISVIGVNEKPKSAVLRSTDTYTSVEFMEDSFLHPKVDVDFVYILKCAFRNIETPISPNKEQEVMWQQSMSKACKSRRHRKNMAFVLENPNLDKVLTGRNDEFFDSILTIVSRACFFHDECFQYFKAKKNAKPIPKNINLGSILGYLHTEEKTTITEVGCVKLYLVSQYLGLKFVTKLCVAYMTENLNNAFVVLVLIAADFTQDSHLFNAAWLFCMKNKLQVFNTDSWHTLDCRYRNTSNHSNSDISVNLVDFFPQTPLSTVHGLLLRCFTDNHGYPPSIEDESGQL